MTPPWRLCPGGKREDGRLLETRLHNYEHAQAPQAVGGLSCGEAERFFQELCHVRPRAKQGAEAIYPESQGTAEWSAFEDDLLEVCEQESRGKYGVTKEQQT